MRFTKPLSLLLPCLVASMVSVSTVQSEHLNDLLVIDCEMQVHALPSSPLYAMLDLTMIQHAYTTLFSELIKFTDEHICDGLDARDFARRFMPSVEGLMASLVYPPYKAKEDKCVHKDGNKIFPDNSFFSDSLLFGPAQAMLKDVFVNVPGCDYESYALRGEACHVKLDVVAGHALGVTLKQCPNSALPYLSVTCAGPMCHSAGIPCDNTSDCGAGMMCQTLMAAEQVEAMMTYMLGPNMMDMMAVNEATGKANFDMGSHMLRMKGHLLGLFRSSYGGAITGNFGVCIPDLETLLKSDAGQLFQAFTPSYPTDGVCKKTPFEVQHHKFTNDAVMACVASGCRHPESAMGNGYCDEECNTDACFQDFGDCIVPDSGGDDFNLRRLVADASPVLGSAIDKIANVASTIREHPVTKAISTTIESSAADAFKAAARKLNVGDGGPVQGVGYSCSLDPQYPTYSEITRPAYAMYYGMYNGNKCDFGAGGFCSVCPQTGEHTYSWCYASNGEKYPVGSPEANLLCGTPSTSCTPEYEWACLSGDTDNYYGSRYIVPCVTVYDEPAEMLSVAQCSLVTSGIAAGGFAKTPVCILKNGLYYAYNQVRVADSNCSALPAPKASDLTCDPNTIDVKSLSIPFIKEWDGVLPSGEKDDSTARMTGTAFGKTIVDSSSEDMPFIHHDCENLIGVKLAHHPKWHLGFKFPLVNQVLNIVYRLNEHLQRDDQLAKDEANFNPGQLLVNFGLWQLPTWMYLVEKPFFARNPNGKATPPKNNLLDRVLNMLPYYSSGLDQWSVEGLPSTCTFETILETGECAFEFDGLESFFSDTSAVRVSVHQCKGAGSKFGLPAFGVALGSTETPEGPTVTNLVETLNMCETDADCTSRLGPAFMCLQDTVEYLNQAYQAVPAFLSQFVPGSSIPIEQGVDYGEAGLDLLKNLYGDAIHCPLNFPATCSNICIPNAEAVVEEKRVVNLDPSELGKFITMDELSKVVTIKLLLESDGAFIGEHNIDIVGQESSMMPIPGSAVPLTFEVAGVESVDAFHATYADALIASVLSAVKAGVPSGTDVVVVLDHVELTSSETTRMRRTASATVTVTMHVDSKPPSMLEEGELANAYSEAAKKNTYTLMKASVGEMLKDPVFQAALDDTLPGKAGTEMVAGASAIGLSLTLFVTLMVATASSMFV